MSYLAILLPGLVVFGETFLFWFSIIVFVGLVFRDFLLKSKRERWCVQNDCFCACHSFLPCRCKCHYFCDFGVLEKSDEDKTLQKSCNACCWLHYEDAYKIPIYDSEQYSCGCTCHHPRKSKKSSEDCNCCCHRWCGRWFPPVIKGGIFYPQIFLLFMLSSMLKLNKNLWPIFNQSEKETAG